jgi:hypothetical protein
MQPTNARDKRTDRRRKCRTGLTLEDALTRSRMRVMALNYSRGGICIEVSQPLWPGMQFWIATETQPPAAGAGAGPAAVRWCHVVRTAGSARNYIAGLQFCPASRHLRPGCRFQVIPGGADGHRFNRL